MSYLREPASSESRKGSVRGYLYGIIRLQLLILNARPCLGKLPCVAMMLDHGQKLLPRVGLMRNHRFIHASSAFCGLPLPIMKMRELDRLLSAAPDNPTIDSVMPGFADAILAKLPGMRFVIPGSHPGVRVLVLAGLLGLLTLWASVCGG